MNRTWVYMADGAVIGYISVAMGHMRPDRDPALRGMGYGNVPALLVGYLATDKRHVRQGVASSLLSWAVREAIQASKRVGCRILMLNPIDDPAVRQFYPTGAFDTSQPATARPTRSTSTYRAESRRTRAPRPAAAGLRLEPTIRPQLHRPGEARSAGGARNGQQMLAGQSYSIVVMGLPCRAAPMRRWPRRTSHLTLFLSLPYGMSQARAVLGCSPPPRL